MPEITCAQVCKGGMTSEQWQRVKAIVSDAWQVEASRRSDFVASACAGDAEMSREVSSLLASIDEVGDRFERPALEMTSAAPALQAMMRAGVRERHATASMVGQRIGPYEIRRELGRGGMGSVYLAERADAEFRQQVALKIIKRGMDTDAIVRRFRHERQILAGLNHPHIARLLDGGSTSDGVPYLVMEYVEGQPITAHSDAQALPVDARLALFRQVCGAVAYAHQNLVVHRDIKPSNVLVTADGEPKLLDFGLATILNPTGGRGEMSESVQGWMTPDFASPEQVRGERVTTATDVYSLGVLLYELLCGQRPFRRAANTAQWLRVIAEEEPEKPSAAVARRGTSSDEEGRDDAAPTADAVAAARNTKPARLQRMLRGDLDTIVLKALHSEPARRYPTAQALSEDLHRYLVGLPVSARRETFAYHATRFIRRHKAAVLTASLMAATLTVATGVTMAQARIARRERANADRRFRDVRQLATAFLFDFHDAIAPLPGATPAREMVVKTAQLYLDSLAQEAAGDRELTAELATAYMKLGDVQGRPSASRTGDTDAALRSYEHALALRRQLAALDPGNAELEHSVAGSLVRIGPIFQVRGDPASAVARTREAMDIMDRLLVRAPSADVRRDAFRAPVYLGDALGDTGDYDGALAMYQRALVVADTARADPPESDYRHRVAVARERLGIMLMIKGEYARALASYRDALANDVVMMTLAPDSAVYMQLAANAHYYIGDALRALKTYPEALSEGRRALTMYEQLARADPKDAGASKNIGGSTHAIAETMLDAGDLGGAQQMVERAVAIRRELAERDKGSVEYPNDLADSLMLWGEVLIADQDPARALAKLDEAREIREPIATARRQQTVYARGLAQQYTDLGDAHLQLAGRSAGTAAAPHWRDARRWYQRALALWQELDRRGALWANERGQADRTARSLAACERALGGV